MSKKANPTLVGAFILIALCLALAAVVILGKIKFKDNRLHCVAFFTGSLYGLDVGAPVTFRGVTIGRVSAVRISFDKQKKDYLIPVYIDIEQRPVLSGEKQDEWQPEKIRAMFQHLIDKGVRAQLKITSLLTGKLYIDLAFFPDTPITRYRTDDTYLEIPTQPSGLEQITQKLEKLPLDEILNKTAAALDGINSIINSEETRNVLSSFNTTLHQLNTLITRLNTEFPEVTEKIHHGLASFTSLADTATSLLRSTDKELPPISAELKKLLTELNSTAGALTRTLESIGRLTAEDSMFTYQIGTSLREIEQAAISIRHLTDYLQQTPNALIFGQAKESP
ncbi:MAG: MCE family protein [Desulfobulbus sp.]|nr:MCE family protein [Desulfobulbus sp.]